MELKFRGFKVSTKITKIKTPRNFQRIRYSSVEQVLGLVGTKLARI